MNAYRSTSIYRFTSRNTDPVRFHMHAGEVSIFDAASWEEVDQLHATVFKESLRFAQAIERNNAELITSGIAERVQVVDNPPKPTPTSKYFYAVNPRTRFHVVAGETKIKGITTLDPQKIEVGIAYPPFWGFHQIGRRILRDGEVIEAEPMLDGFTQEDVLKAGKLLDQLLYGAFPHIGSNLTRLFVRGSLDNKMQKYYEKTFPVLFRPIRSLPELAEVVEA